MTESSGKGRPTPKRSEAQGRRTGPVAPPPTTRKEAAKRLREQQAAGRKRLRDGTIAGDERAMLPRDAGPARRLVRDVVDSRRTLGVALLPVALLLVIAQVVKQPALLQVALAVWTATVVVVLFDLFVTGRRIRRTLGRELPGQGRMRGHIGYGLLRSTVFRRFRMPPPKVTIGTQV